MREGFDPLADYLRIFRIEREGAGTFFNAAAQVFRVLCALIPQKLRLPTAICALQDWMGGKDGLRLLVNTPLPPSSVAGKYVKTAQAVQVPIFNATTSAISTGLMTKSPLNVPKKSSKSQTSGVGGIVAGVSVPDVGVSAAIAHPGPAWMPVDTYARLTQVIGA